MNSNATALLGLTVIVGALSGLLMFATLRLFSAARQRQLSRRAHGRDPEMLSVALEEAITRLKAQERATAARAEASERLSGEIISGLTSGLIVVGLDGDVRIMNPAARRLRRLPHRDRRAGAVADDRRVPVQRQRHPAAHRAPA
jgi:nitrogen fixation/metabolism regulation signal transduction histidine kinase